MENMYIKSPMNYIGNKYRIIDQIKKFFPNTINTMVDLFCGGCDVTINTNAKIHFANDINYFVIDIFKSFQIHSIEYILSYIDNIINTWNLNKTNTDSYIKFRNYYNKTKNPLDLYILTCFSFNYQFRFNSKHEFNNSFGKNRSCFNNTMRNNLIKIHNKIKNITFSSNEFQNFNFEILNKNDFLYADPPYLISCGTYNDGKRGFTGWCEKQENELYYILTDLGKHGIKFCLSNLIEHKGRKNDLLLKWCNNNKYNMYNINFNYNNCNYHLIKNTAVTKEVIINNY